MPFLHMEAIQAGKLELPRTPGLAILASGRQRPQFPLLWAPSSSHAPLCPNVYVPGRPKKAVPTQGDVLFKGQLPGLWAAMSYASPTSLLA